MNPTTSISNTQVYGAHADYKAPPSEAQADAGVVPLDTLPAAWWNQLWYDITSRNNSMVETVLNIRDEILSVLSDANITPAALQTNQLLQSIEVIRRRFPTFDAISHDPIPGSVISSAARNSVSVDSATGQMTPNALSDWTSNKSVKTVIGEVDQKVDDVSTTVTEAIAAETDAREAKDVASVANTTTSNTLTTTITSSDGTTHQSQGQDIVRSVDVDATTDVNTVKVSVNGVEDSDTVVKTVSATRSGDTVTIEVNGVQDTFSVASAAQDYKETEQNTGKKWVNGDKVYSKTVIGRNKQITHETIPFATLTKDTSLGNASNQSNARIGYAVYHDKLYIGDASGKVYSFDGYEWVLEYTASTISSSDPRIQCMVVCNDMLYVGIGTGIDKGAIDRFDGTSWERLTVMPIRNIQDVGKMIATDTHVYFIEGSSYVCFFEATSSSDISIDQMINSPHINDICIYGNDIYAGCGNVSSYTSLYKRPLDNSGSLTIVGSTTYQINCLCVYGGKLYAGWGAYNYGQAGIASYDGTSFDPQINIGDNSPYAVNALCVYDGKLYAGCGYTNPSTYLSTILNPQYQVKANLFCFDGTTWSRIAQIPQYSIQSITAYRGKLYLGYALKGGQSSQTSLSNNLAIYDISTATVSYISNFWPSFTFSWYAVYQAIIPYYWYADHLNADYEHPAKEEHEMLIILTHITEGAYDSPMYKSETDYITYTPNNHINTIPDFKHLVKCDRVVDDKPSEIDVTINPTTGNIDVGSPVRDYEHLNGVQLLLEYTKEEA